MIPSSGYSRSDANSALSTDMLAPRSTRRVGRFTVDSFIDALCDAFTFPDDYFRALTSRF